MRSSRSFAILSTALLVCCGAAFADSISFGGLGGDLHSNTHTFTSGSSSLTVTGYSNTDLYSKSGGGDETGLGLVNGGSDREIGGKSNFVQFLSAGITSITIGSVQPGETWALYGSTTAGTKGTLITGLSFTKTGDSVVVTISGLGPGDKYLSLGAPKGDILLDSVNFSSVPEPGTPALLMTLGLVGLFAIGGRKLSKQTV